MNLQKFISSSLCQIMAGITDAQEEWIKSGKGAINPVWDNTDRLRDHTHTVEFDIAVTVESSQTGSAGAGIKVLGASIGANGDLSSKDSSASRLKFSIPISPPVQIVIGGDKTPLATV